MANPKYLTQIWNVPCCEKLQGIDSTTQLALNFWYLLTHALQMQHPVTLSSFPQNRNYPVLWEPMSLGRNLLKNHINQVQTAYLHNNNKSHIKYNILLLLFSLTCSLVAFQHKRLRKSNSQQYIQKIAQRLTTESKI